MNSTRPLIVLAAILHGVAGLAGCSSEVGGPVIPVVPDSGGGGGDTDAAADAAKLGFSANCTDNAQCESGLCFRGGKRSYCTMKCTLPTAATDCPVPPTLGACNNQGYCKAPE